MPVFSSPGRAGQGFAPTMPRFVAAVVASGRLDAISWPFRFDPPGPVTTQGGDDDLTFQR